MINSCTSVKTERMYSERRLLTPCSKIAHPVNVEILFVHTSYTGTVCCMCGETRLNTFDNTVSLPPPINL